MRRASRRAHRPWWKRPWLRLRGRGGQEIAWLGIGIGACLLLFAFVILAGEVTEGDTQAFDVRILRALRSSADPSKPIGPAWIEGTLLDLTALGGSAVLSLVVLVVVGFLLLQTRYRTALVIMATAISGEAVNAAMKRAFNRTRPSVVPHLRDVFTTSFPSGHAMESALVYLTLAAILMRVADSRLTKAYILTVAVLLTMVVGVSRVFLGVHYPTDVLGGWIIGFVWASVCWLVAARFEGQSGIQKEKEKPAVNSG